MKITYKEHENGVYYPNLTLTEGSTCSIGKYGRLYLDYLKKHRRGDIHNALGRKSTERAFASSRY